APRRYDEARRDTGVPGPGQSPGLLCTATRRGPRAYPSSLFSVSLVRYYAL
ncbi:MAG: hypothetical protein AVDCRST_MAG78-1303, partial [uncultured Rubrobacteraceae bacterium]